MFTKSGITSLVIPATVRVIENEAFCQCSTLDSIRFEESATPLTIGYLPARNVWNDEQGPFYYAPLTSIYVNRELVASEEYAAARDQADEGIFSTLSNSRNVTVTLQGNVKTISDYMFSGVNMQTIWIPREVTTIGNMAFYDCKSLEGVTLAHPETSNPPALGTDVFDGTILSWIALEDGSDTNLNAFKTAANWSEHAAKIKVQQK